MELELGNNTAAFTNFLASVYKSELILEPVDILAYVFILQQGFYFYLHLLQSLLFQGAVRPWLLRPGA